MRMGRSPKKTLRSGRRPRSQSVYSFGPLGTDGDKSLRDLLGGKGANLAEMCRMGLPVPPGFTISTEVCNIYYKEKAKVPEAIDHE